MTNNFSEWTQNDIHQLFMIFKEKYNKEDYNEVINSLKEYIEWRKENRILEQPYSLQKIIDIYLYLEQCYMNNQIINYYEIIYLLKDDFISESVFHLNQFIHKYIRNYMPIVLIIIYFLLFLSIIRSMIFPNRIRYQTPYSLNNTFELPQYLYQQTPIINQQPFLSGKINVNTEEPKNNSIEKMFKEELLKNDFIKSFIREIME